MHWLTERFPSTRLYGPYHTGGHSYYPVDGTRSALVHEVLPVLEAGICSPRWTGMRPSAAWRR